MLFTILYFFLCHTPLEKVNTVSTTALPVMLISVPKGPT